MRRPTQYLRLAAALSGLMLASASTTGATRLGAQATEQKAPKHHSKLKGAIVGGIAGKMAGGHTKAGAVAGVLVQHHRNKKAKKG